jgi:U3 small nucleolar RNA-associated protein 10
LVLELIEGSVPGDHPALFKHLFTVLGELQQLKQQSGSDLVYLQSLVLGSLTPIVNSIRTESDTTEYRAAVRADLLVDCIRHSTSPQVQNAALLLISTLASWVPELILHNLMPIFTFIGSNLLRQQDDYSAHVVDQVRPQPVIDCNDANEARQFRALYPPLLHHFGQSTGTSSPA